MSMKRRFSLADVWVCVAESTSDGIKVLKLSSGEVNRRFYGRKLRSTAPLLRSK